MIFISRLIIQVSLVLFMFIDAYATMIPPYFLDTVVAIGSRNQDSTIHWEGTGFIVGKFNKNIENRKEYILFLVTNKHVIKDKKSMVVRFNTQSNETSKDFDCPLLNEKGDKIWTGHASDNIDVAVVVINVKLLDEQKMKYNYFRSDTDLLNIAQMSEKGMSEGDFIYVLGFPLGIVDLDRQYVIARSGSIARIRDVLEKHGNKIYIDAFVFPGNSGGPVISRPEITRIEGTKSMNTAHLIGIIRSYIPYQEVAISPQTKRPRVIFEENTGLAEVIPADYIMETIEEAYKKLQ